MEDHYDRFICEIQPKAADSQLHNTPSSASSNQITDQSINEKSISSPGDNSDSKHHVKTVSEPPACLVNQSTVQQTELASGDDTACVSTNAISTSTGV